jgi:hypothetical protein
MKTQSHVPRFTNGELRGYRLNAFLPDLYMFTDTHFDGLIVASGKGPEFDIYDKNGNRSRTVRLEVPRMEIPDYFLTEFKSVIKGRRDVLEVIYPEKLPYYNFILPIKNLGYYLPVVSEETVTHLGYIVDNQGKHLGRFTVVCGELGMLVSLNGRLIMVSSSEGEPVIREIAPVR